MVRLKFDESSLVVKSNQIIEACYSLPLNGHRLLAIALGSVPRDAEQFPLLSIPVRDIAELIPALASSKRRFEVLEKVVDEVMDSTITLRQNDSWVKFQWLTKAAYKNGVIHLQLNDELLPYFTNLLNRFTSYQLRHVIGFRSAYAFRIYDLCKQYMRIGERTISIDELRKWLDIPDDQYKQVGHLKSRVVKPALEDINRSSDLEVMLEADIKEGRKTVGLRFTISEKSQQAMPLEDSLPTTLQRLVTHGVALPEARKMVKEFGEPYCAEKLDWVQRRHVDGKVENLGAFTVSAIRNDYKKTKAPLEKQQEQRKIQEDQEEKSSIRDKKLFEAFQKHRVDEFVKGLSKQDSARVEKAFLDSVEPSSVIHQVHAKFGFQHQLIRGSYRAYIAHECLAESTEDEFEQYRRGR